MKHTDRRAAQNLNVDSEVNYGKFGHLQAKVKAVHGKKTEGT